MKRYQPARHGYALLVTLLFVVLFTAMLGVAWRSTASALRLESVRAIQARRDQGSIHAMARAMRLLETGLPPSTPYVCAVTIDTADGPRAYAVTFVAEDGSNWSVRSAALEAGKSPPPMPDTFAPADGKRAKKQKK